MPRSLGRIQKEYSDELEESRKAALTVKNLDEALRILKAQKVLEEEMKEDKAGPGVLLISAKYGEGDKWIDVTANLGRLLMRRRPITVSPEDLRVNDPAFGIMKSLAVVYRMRGTTHLEMLPDGANVAIPSSSKRK